MDAEGLEEGVAAHGARLPARGDLAAQTREWVLERGVRMEGVANPIDFGAELPGLSEEGVR